MVRAQAIAARTYAAYERRFSRPRSLRRVGHDRVPGLRWFFDDEHPDSDVAVVDTAGPDPDVRRRSRVHPVLQQQRRLDLGRQRALSRRASRIPYDGWSGNPNHTWSVRVDDRAIERRWSRIGNLRAIRVTSRDGHGAWGGRIRTMVLDGSKANVRLLGDDLRLGMGLRSEWLRFTARAK